MFVSAGCNCSTDGTLSGQVCAPFGGQCPCVSNVEGLLCDTCTPGFHSLTTTGCRGEYYNGKNKILEWY